MESLFAESEMMSADGTGSGAAMALNAMERERRAMMVPLNMTKQLSRGYMN